MSGNVKTKAGRVLSDADIDRLAARAEQGVDLSRWAPRRGRPSLDIAATKPSPRIAVRLPDTLHRRVADRAAKEGRTVSQVVRDLLTDYAAKGH